MNYDDRNIFAKILRGEIPCKKVFENEDVLAFEDVHPAAPTHILVVPKGEYVSFDDFTEKADDATIARFFKAVRAIAADLGLPESGYRLITNHGAHASQSVPHFHVHIMGGRNLGGLVPDDTSGR